MTLVPTITIDKGDRRRIERTLRDIPNGVPLAISGAITRTARPVRTLVRRSVAKNLNIAQKELKAIDAVRLRFAGSGRFKTGARISVSGPRIPIKRFAPRQTARGVSYRGRGGRKKIASAFIVATVGDHVFIRRGDARLPITKLRGASPGHAAIGDKAIAAYVRDEIPAKMSANVANQVERLLKRAGRGGG